MVSLTVCQSQPNSPATTDTARRYLPTCLVNQRPARWGHRAPPRGDPLIAGGPRPLRTAAVGTRPADLVPGQHHRPAEHRQIGQAHHPPLLDPAPRPAPGTILLPRRRAGHMHHQRRVPAGRLDTQHTHRRQAHQQLTHSGRVGLHRGPPGRGILVETDTGRTPVPHPHRHAHRPESGSQTRPVPPQIRSSTKRAARPWTSAMDRWEKLASRLPAAAGW